MDTKTLDALLRRANRARSDNDRLIIASEVHELLSTGRVDARSYELGATFLRKFAMPVPKRSTAGRRIGETYVALWHGGHAVVAVLRVRAGVTPGIRAPSLGERATLQVEASLQGLQAFLAEMDLGLPPSSLVNGYHLEVGLPSTEDVVDGRSLGLPVAMAILSLHLETPPRADVAASATVNVDGSIGPVGFVEEKSVALRLQWPEVSVFAVADKQNDMSTEGLCVKRCATLGDAVELFGLKPNRERLPGASAAALRKALNGFEHAVPRTHGARAWNLLATQAAAVAASSRLSEFERARGRIWASFFALHAGDRVASEQHREAVPVTLLDQVAPITRAWWYLAEASGRIDLDPESAVEPAKKAIAIATDLCAEEQDSVLGRAYGTLGRAYLHAGRLEEAEPWLKRGAQFHAQRRPDEEARSRCYLATCQRMGGKPRDALEQIAAAFEADCELDASDDARVTECYLLLERGRSHLALGQLEQAERAFDRCVALQSCDLDHPRISALRGLASVYRASRDGEGRKMLNRCLAVANDECAPSTLREVAALAAGDALIVGETSPDILQAWKSVYPEAVRLEEIARVIARSVY